MNQHKPPRFEGATRDWKLSRFQVFLASDVFYPVVYLALLIFLCVVASSSRYARLTWIGYAMMLVTPVWLWFKARILLELLRVRITMHKTGLTIGDTFVPWTELHAIEFASDRGSFGAPAIRVRYASNKVADIPYGTARMGELVQQLIAATDGSDVQVSSARLSATRSSLPAVRKKP